MLKKYAIVLAAGLMTCGFQNTMGSTANQIVISLRDGGLTVADARKILNSQRWSPSDKVAINRAITEASEGGSSSSRGDDSRSKPVDKPAERTVKDKSGNGSFNFGGSAKPAKDEPASQKAAEEAAYKAAEDVVRAYRAANKGNELDDFEDTLLDRMHKAWK